MPTRFGHPLAFGALAGASAWLSLGTFAPLDHGGIVGLLPPLWALALLAAGGACAARLWWPRSLPPLLMALTWPSALAWFVADLPAAAIWSGAMSAIPWLLLGTAVVLAVTGRQLLPSCPRRSIALAMLLSGLWMGLVAVALRPQGFSGDEPHYLVIAESIWRDGDIELANNYSERHYAAYYPGELPDPHVVPGFLAEQYPLHSIGAAVLALPALVSGGAPAVRAWFVLLAAVGLGLTWATAYRVSGSATAAWAGWAAVTLPAPLAIHGSRVYPDGPATLAVAAALWLLARLLRDESAPASQLVMVGAALTTLPWLHLRLAVLSAVLGLALLVALSRRRGWVSDAAVLMAPAAIGAALLFGSTFVMFRTWDPTEAFRMTDRPAPVWAVPGRVVAMLVDQEFGLLPYSPALALCGAGLWGLWTRARVLAVSAASAMALTVFIGGMWAWWGGHSAPARFLVPLLPVIALVVSAGWVEAAPLRRAAMACLITLGAVLTVFMAVGNEGRHSVNAPDGTGTVFEWISSQVDLSLSLPSYFRPGVRPDVEATIAALWAIAGVLTLLALDRLARHAHGRGTRWGLAGTAMMVWIWAGVAAGWWWRGLAPATPDKAALGLLHAAPRPWLQRGYASDTLAMLPRDAAFGRLSIHAAPGSDATVQLHATFVPAGRYEVQVADGPVREPWYLEIGQDALPYRPDDSGAPTVLTLPVPVRSIRVIGPSADARLRPLEVRARWTGTAADTAWRAHRWGRRVIYECDRAAGAQPDGLWLSGDRVTRLLVADVDGTVPERSALQFEAGPAPVRLSIGGEGREAVVLSLAAFEKRITTFPGRPADLRPTSIRVEGGFEASALRPGSRDTRWLGVFVSVP